MLFMYILSIIKHSTNESLISIIELEQMQSKIDALELSEQVALVTMEKDDNKKRTFIIIMALLSVILMRFLDYREIKDEDTGEHLIHIFNIAGDTGHQPSA